MDEQTVAAIVRRRVAIRIVIILSLCLLMLMCWHYHQHVLPRQSRKRKRVGFRYTINGKKSNQAKLLKRLTALNDVDTKDILRMNRSSFVQFCELLCRQGGLRSSRHVSVEEKVACFLAILGHHLKNRVVRLLFRRSGHTVSTYFHEVLKSVLSLHEVLVPVPEKVPDNCEDDPWKHFPGCLGALDGTYIRVEVPLLKQPMYRNRKGQISVNVLGVCDRQMRFVYVLTGWEGSAADAKVLGDAMSRPNGLKVPAGCYYLVDAAYANAPGFLAPFRSTRYHLQEWGNSGMAPQTYKEYFNLKHSGARNVIERSFGLLKKRFGILRSPCFYPLSIQNDIILACTLVHNFLRNESSDDVLDDEASDDEADIDELYEDPEEGIYDEEPVISGIQGTNEWRDKRTIMANEMFVNWRIQRGFIR